MSFSRNNGGVGSWKDAKVVAKHLPSAEQPEKSAKPRDKKSKKGKTD
jgi:hypothetical protein